jgi:hypothetical protein
MVSETSASVGDSEAILDKVGASALNDASGNWETHGEDG